MNHDERVLDRLDRACAALEAIQAHLASIDEKVTLVFAAMLADGKETGVPASAPASGVSSWDDYVPEPSTGG